jgi:uncharacterized RDD family membrane protein YckC/Tfp pilus assembly major pilin PilA
MAVETGARYCASCGLPIEGVPASSVASVNAPRYAGFWRRVAASFVDGLVVAGAAVAVLLGLLAARVPEETAVTVTRLASAVGAWLYSAVLTSSSWQATVGKRALHIKVTNAAGERIGFGRATGRYFAAILSALTLGIGFLMAGWNQRRRALHDMVAGTLVVSREATSAQVVAGLGPPKVTAGVVAIVVPASLVWVLAVGAAISIPAYQDYQVRVQIADGLGAATPYQQKVVEAVDAGKDWEDIDSQSLGLSMQGPSPYLQSIEIVNGVVVLIYGGKAESAITGGQLTLVPAVDGQGQVVWICGHASTPEGVRTALAGYRQYNNIPQKYLPSKCR